MGVVYYNVANYYITVECMLCGQQCSALQSMRGVYAVRTAMECFTKHEMGLPD